MNNDIQSILSYSKEIVTKLGEQSLEYKAEDKPNGYNKISTYNYSKDNIKIIYEEGDNEPLYIKVIADKNEVLYYHYPKARVRFIDGKWVNNIKDIHNKMDQEYQEKHKIFPNMSELLDNADYFKYYFDSLNKKSVVFEYIQRRLAQRGVFFAYRYRKIHNYETYPEIICEWNVIYNNEIVLQMNIHDGEKFSGKSFIPASYSKGEWLERFLLIMKEAIKLEELYRSQQMDAERDKIIKL